MHNDAAITAATRTTEAGALAGFLGWAAQVNWIGWIGVAVAVAGYLTNLYFQRKRFRMQKEEHDARMARILEERDERKETSQGN